MTHAMTPPPTPNLTLEEVVADLTDLWNQACQTSDSKERARAISNGHPRAREDLSVALRTRAALQALLGIQDDTGGNAPPDPTPEQADAEDRPDAEAAEDEDVAEDESSPDGAGETSAQPAALTPAPHTDPSWPDGSLGVGVLSLLAATLASGEGLQLNLTRAGAHLHVTVTPKRVLGEPGGTALPLVVSGTPQELDRDLPGALGVYGAARMTARDAANDLLRRTHEAAEAAKQQKVSAPPTSQRASQTAQQRAEESRLRNQASLTVTTPAGSVITLTEEKGATRVLQPGVALKLDPQKVSLTVDLDGHQPFSAALTLKAREVKTLDAALQAVTQSGLF